MHQITIVLNHRHLTIDSRLHYDFWGQISRFKNIFELAEEHGSDIANAPDLGIHEQLFGRYFGSIPRRDAT